MTPAALKAFLEGNTENLIAASTPGGIEAQEKRGQLQQATLQTLPISLREPRVHYESLGFVFGRQIDKLFVEATYPVGWSKKPTDHSMWTQIVDHKGRTRGMIFYKAAFYDQRANAHLESRFGWTCVDVGTERTVLVRDACKLIQHQVSGLLVPNWDDRETAQLAHDKYLTATQKVEDWLDANYADWRSPLAYWDC